MNIRTRGPIMQFLFENRFFFLLAVLLSMILVIPIAEGFVALQVLMDIFLTAILILLIHSLSERRSHLVIATVLALPMLAALWSLYFSENRDLLLIEYVCGIGFFLYAVIRILGYISRQNEVTGNMIAGAAVVYLLMALMWSFIYRALEMARPGSFKMVASDIHELLQFTYFSLVTITTVGYGDITPATSLASAMAVLEAIVGQLFLVVAVAWLVGLHAAQSYEKRSHKADK